MGGLFDSPSFFVFGAGRSGTTLLAFMLSGQPGTLCLNDTSAFVRLAEAAAGSARAGVMLGGVRPSTVGALRTGGLRAAYYDILSRSLRRRLAVDVPVSPAVRKSFIRLLTQQYRHQNDWYDFQTRYAEPLSRALVGIAHVDDLDTRQLIGPILQQIAVDVAPVKERRAVGEKTPLHTLLAPWLLELYPKAPGILLVRDPITNVASILKRHKPLATAIRLYDRFVPSIIWLAAQPRIHALTYRSLLLRPKASMESVADYLDLPEFDSTVPVNPFGKDRYTGSEVDPGREPDPESVLDAPTRNLLRRRHSDVYELMARLEVGAG